MEADDTEDIKKCDCLQECNSIEYEIQVIKTKLKYEHHYKTYNNAKYWINSTYYGALVIYFGDTEYTALKQYASYGTVSFLSEVGGLLSLFLGVSVISVIEIFYFLVIRAATEFVSFIVKMKKVEKLHVHRSDLTNSLNKIQF